MKEKLVRYAKVIAVLPLVFVWDVFYWSLSKLYDGATFLDEKGGEFIDKFVNSD